MIELGIEPVAQVVSPINGKACGWVSMRRLLASFLLALGAMLVGCAGLPPRTAVSDSFVLTAEADAPLARAAAAGLLGSAGREGAAGRVGLNGASDASAVDALISSSRQRESVAANLSAFKLMPLASVAYGTRLELARLAQRGVDLQTFVFNGDAVGAVLLRELQRAAARGVRVRLLIDDLHGESAEALLSDLGAYEHVQVRLVTPFTRWRGSRAAKLISSLDELGRVNHRMHNKLYIADNRLAVFGGRNIGDEYFMRSGASGNFVDLDALAAGPVVAQMSASFDRYWNSEHAWPMDLIVPPRGTAEQRRARFLAAVASLPEPAPDLGIPQRLAAYASTVQDIRNATLSMTPAQAQLLDDPVDKLARSRVMDRSGTVRDVLASAMMGSQLEVFVVSPYFIPGDMGMRAIRSNRERGVRLRLLTNSLAATDEPAVHAGYIVYRKAMVEAGVEIFELSPSLARQAAKLGRFSADGSAPPALHAKYLVIDQARVFIGSMNLDGRSERYNTEVGVLIDSTALARELLAMVDFESSAWRVSAGVDGRLRWSHGSGAQQVVHDSEPEASWLRHLGSRVLGALLPHDWL